MSWDEAARRASETAAGTVTGTLASRVMDGAFPRTPQQPAAGRTDDANFHLITYLESQMTTRYAQPPLDSL